MVYTTIVASQVKKIIGAPGKGNVISQNDVFNVFLVLFDSLTSIVQSNLIGIMEDGVTLQNNNPTSGIELRKSGPMDTLGLHGLIGGDELAKANIIGGNGTGIRFSSLAPSNVWVSGNFIGTDTSKTLDFGNTTGLDFGFNAQATDELVGGHLPEHENIIAYNSVGIKNYGQRITFARNQFFCNNQGIANFSVQNANGNISPPTINSSETNLISGISAAGDSVSVYLADTCSAQCQGRFYLGKAIANGSGDWSLAAPFEQTLSIGDKVTAIATLFKNSSAFSSCVTTTSFQPPTGGEDKE